MHCYRNCFILTTTLDVTIQAKILELIKEIQVKKDLSVIYLTHDLVIADEAISALDVSIQA